MQRKRRFSFLILAIVFIMAGVAIYLSATLQTENQAPEDTNAAVPSDCVTQFLTQNNPKNDPNCNGSSCKPIPKYCANNGQFKANKAGDLVVYASDSKNVIVHVNGKVVTMAHVVTKKVVVDMGTTGIKVKVGDQISVQVNIKQNNESFVGWMSPNGGLCGQAPWPTISPAALLSKITLDKNTAMFTMCWADPPEGNSDFDFEDYIIIMAIQNPQATATPVPTATIMPSATPEPTATVIPTDVPTNMPSPTPQPTATDGPINTPNPTNPPLTATPKPTNLPPTALINDKTDTLIFGIAFMVGGLTLYAYLQKKTKLHNSL